MRRNLPEERLIHPLMKPADVPHDGPANVLQVGRRGVVAGARPFETFEADAERE